MEAIARPKFCPECGAAVKPAGRFCGGCGKEILAVGQKPDPPATSPKAASRGSSAVDPAIVIAGGWLAMGSPELRAARGAKLAMLLAVALGCASLAILAWWIDYAQDKTLIDASMLEWIAVGSLAAFALGVLANVRLGRDAPRTTVTGAAKALAAVPLAMALLSLAMVSSAERNIDQARRLKQASLENPTGVDLEARNRHYFGPRPSSKPAAIDPDFPVR